MRYLPHIFDLHDHAALSSESIGSITVNYVEEFNIIHFKELIARLCKRKTINCDMNSFVEKLNDKRKQTLVLLYLCLVINKPEFSVHHSQAMKILVERLFTYVV